MLLPLSKSTIAANVILAVFASAAVALRIVARQTKKVPFKADDFAIVFALASDAVSLCRIAIDDDP